MRSPVKFLVIAAAVAAVASLVLFLQPHTTSAPAPVVQNIETTQVATSSGETSVSAPRVSGTVTNTATPSVVVKASSTPIEIKAGERATLTVDGKSYPVAISESETVADAMKALQSEGVITYTTHEFSGLGAFVDSINNKSNADSFYWILSVNGKKSSTGISQTPVHVGDRIVWTYEHSY